MSVDTSTLAAHGAAGAVGLLVAGWAAQSYFWYGYQLANPTVGDVSTSGGFAAGVAGLFVVGITLAFVAFVRGLSLALGDE